MLLFAFQREKALAMAGELKKVAQVFAIGITNQTDDKFLSALSSGGVQNENWFNTPTFEGLQGIRDQVIQLTCAAQNSDTTTRPSFTVSSTENPSPTPTTRGTTSSGDIISEVLQDINFHFI